MGRIAKTAGTALTRGRKDSRWNAVARVEALDNAIQNVIAGLGTNRDKATYTEYVMPAPLSSYQLSAIYRGSWLARKCIDIPASDMTREWRTVSFDSDNEDDMFAIEQAEADFSVADKCEQALRWAALYGGAGIVIGTKRAELQTELIVENIGQDDLDYLLVVDRTRLTNGPVLVKDPGDPDFCLPEYYTLADSTVRVHHTRVVRFNGSPVPWDVWVANGRWDDSILQVVYDSLRQADTSTAAINSMLFEANLDVIKVEQLGDILARKNGAQIIRERFQLSQFLKSFNHTLLLDATEEYDKKSNNFGGLDAIMTKFFVNFAGAADIPVTRLFGQSATGLNANGDNDVRNYYDSIKLKQKSKLRPQLTRIDQVLVRSTLGNLPDDFDFTFNSLWQLSETEQADVEKKRAERDKIYIDSGVVTEGTVAKDLKENGTYSNLTDEDVELVDNLSRAAMEQAAENIENPPAPSNATQTAQGQQGAQNVPIIAASQQAATPPAPVAAPAR